MTQSGGFTVGRFVGDVPTCFADLINKYRGLKVHELIAEFCNGSVHNRDKTTVEIVQRWQRGQYLPGGLLFVQLYCLLQFAGYDVEEYNRLDGDAKLLARGIALGLLNPTEVEKKLEYQPNACTAIWDILTRGRTYPKREAALAEYLTQSRRNKILKLEQGWRERIAELVKSFGVVQPVAPPVVQSAIDPAIPTAFARQVGATTALGNALSSDPETICAVLSATRDGRDLAELVGVLERFFSVQE